jgi:predicted Fe-S protein YdhL (DUF1289 family)
LIGFIGSAIRRPPEPLESQAAMDMPRIETPCIKVCVIDRKSRLCEGCGRTIDEIAAWSVYTHEDRRRIMAELPSRLRSVGKA